MLSVLRRSKHEASRTATISILFLKISLLESCPCERIHARDVDFLFFIVTKVFLETVLVESVSIVTKTWKTYDENAFFKHSRM